MSSGCTDSCSSSNTHKKHRCPVNGKEYEGVSEITILHHVKEPWRWHGKHQSYYFCDDPECDVVYFGQDNSIIEKSALRTIVGIKEKSGTFPICYCFGISANQAAANPETKTYVLKKTKEHVCRCEVRNPSGKCCLKDFPIS